jgi:NADH:ubiquinone oxidoreductase subunit B-like Fe-S oxidoreductase
MCKTLMSFQQEFKQHYEMNHFFKQIKNSTRISLTNVKVGSLLCSVKLGHLGSSSYDLDSN